MPWCGVPYPRRLGGGRPRYIVILEGLLASREARGLSVETGSYGYARCVALAREIEATWSTSARLGQSRDPYRMDLSVLERWEKLLKLPRSRRDTERARRRRLANHESLIGQATITSLVAAQAAITVGERFVAIEHIPLAGAVITVPDAGYPFGAVLAGAPWSSSVCRTLILCQKLAGDTEGSFYEAMGLLVAALDPIMPAWMTFDWYRTPESAPIAVTDGPSMAGFYLDDEHGLDNNVFSE